MKTYGLQSGIRPTAKFQNGTRPIAKGTDIIDAGPIDADSLMPKLLRPVTIDAGLNHKPEFYYRGNSLT